MQQEPRGRGKPIWWCFDENGVSTLHRCFAAASAAFADVDHVLVADGTKLAATAAAAGI